MYFKSLNAKIYFANFKNTRTTIRNKDSLDIVFFSQAKEINDIIDSNQNGLNLFLGSDSLLVGQTKVLTIKLDRKIKIKYLSLQISYDNPIIRNFLTLTAVKINNKKQCNR